MGSKTIKKLADNIDPSMFEFAEYDESKSELTGYSNYSFWRSTLQVFMKNKTAVAFLIIVAVIVVFTLLQPYLPNQKSPTQIYIDPATGLQYRNVPPGEEFLFGSNSIGQDLWSRVWSGTRTSIFIGFAVGLFEAIVGITIGALWGYVRKLDAIITEIYNVWDNIPTTVVLIILTYIMKPSIPTIIFAMCMTGWLQMARFVRNLIIIIRDREYNLASRCLGTPTKRIITKNLLPYLVSVIMLRMALAIPAAIGNEVFLSYIGMGLPLDIPSLGNLINEGRALMMVPSSRYQLFFPAAVISLVTVSFYVIGNVFADSADPRNHV
ncbi:Oligopeptide transport system permease protein OppC [bioreactor metagenome]|jgi:oligopeptide transport system permease protein|uniref:Oligopeptide transport system permease protein n=2 Tax=root TaxID=1 RepID=A0A562JLR6_9FIRM|nr:ABC transporter permease [Sedimentibacter saalensis]MEA5096007.1 ABC transporter permease [Sedimentibacter saalensis]TWH83905.1 oligopeptide transport system permease protein [Sedimentibacter saalensis]